jgi:Superfamily I DNA and RNA helicases
MGLRKGQKELVEQYRGGCCAIPAIPGGGKTHSLSLWAAEMITQGLNRPGKILIVTYMNSAVNNFKQRISRELELRGVNGSRDYHVSTIHGLCLQIIKERPGFANINEEFDIIDGTSQLYIINGAVEEWKRKHENIFRYYIDENLTRDGRFDKIANNWQDRLCGVIGSTIGDFKSRGIKPEEAIRLTGILKNDSLLKHAAYIYDIYDKRLKTSGLLDFNDMLHKAKYMLSTDEELLEKFRKRYRFVCEDEAQDSNLLQSEILTLIANGNLLRVGDSNQAICSTFTNSDFKYFKNFCDMPQTTVYRISQSSRSTTDIIELANYFVRYVNESHPVEECRPSLLPQYIEPVDEKDIFRNPVTEEYGIKTAVFNTWEEEMEGVARYVWHMQKKHPDKSIAVLMPTSWKLNDFAELLRSRGIPYEELDSSSGVKTRALKLLGRILALHYSPDDSRKLAAVVGDCFLNELAPTPDGIGNRNADNDMAKKIEIRNRLIDFIGHSPVDCMLYPHGGNIDTGNIPEELVGSDLWAAFMESIGEIKELIEFPSTSVEELILEISDKLGFDREERAIAQKVAGDVKFMTFKNPNWQLCDLADELLGNRSMYSYFAGLIWDLKGYEPSPGVVTLSTCHKAKGLEWDVVFISGLSFADFPVYMTDRFAGEFWFLKQQYKNPQALMKAELDKLTNATASEDPFVSARIETISERARLLYVGITRAKEYLFLSGFHSNKGKRNEIQPSAYLGVLKRHIDGRAHNR